MNETVSTSPQDPAAAESLSEQPAAVTTFEQRLVADFGQDGAHNILTRLQFVDGLTGALWQAGLCPPGVEYAHVFAFHEKFNLMRATAPRHLTKRKLKERIEFLAEELCEFAEGCGLELRIVGAPGGEAAAIVLENDRREQNLADQADALVDLAYVAYGTAVMLGLPWGQLWLDVQRANMAKVPGTTHRGHAVDVTKPEGWIGPVTDEILKAFGYKRADYLDENGYFIEGLCHDDVPHA